MLEYQRPDSTLTLDDGLAEYYASRTDLAGGRGTSPAAEEFFRCHDAAHVVFGCSTTLLDEAIVKIWSFFGTTRGLSLVREYGLSESREIYKRLEFAAMVRTAVLAPVVVPRVMVRCMRMRTRWPWSDFEAHRKMALVDLRHQYGIRVLNY